MKNSLPLLFEIDRSPNVVHHGKTVFRQAVRGVIFQQEKLLMVYSRVNRDYKFPGGGIEPHESHQQALAREILEECGARVTVFLGGLGRVIEYDVPIEKDLELFQMTSHYYLCTVESQFISQKLDQYEKELEFTPEWISIDMAIEANQFILSSPTLPKPKWTMRDTTMLRWIKQKMVEHPGPISTALSQNSI
ncbi:MAG TPA: NUDIX domain-containing protein [Anaerolineaceae bacterium]|nr:NUDIX domain-containing protein [Anaerolineaceae bacterium]HPN51692.1 NUDIX domain-containing protein [Anaerolineaceae bacterium]